MAVNLHMLLVVLPLVFAASMVDAIGGGGGLISLPAYLVAGLPSDLASGSNKLSASFGTLVATFRFFRSGKIMMKPALTAAAMAVIGAFFGAQINERLSDAAFRVVLLVLIPLIAVLMALRHTAPDRALPMTKKRLALCGLIGLAVGAYDGFFGPGTGVLLILGFTWAAGMDTVTASGSSKVVNLASNISALAAHFMNGNILFALAVPAMACSALGGWLGSWLAIRRGAKFIRAVMMGVMALLLVRLAVDYL
ncbi:MAG: TSUP family transporter [Clostridia bacterium]|nr:TSUP family transporter [Clostridia bacterium]